MVDQVPMRFTDRQITLLGEVVRARKGTKEIPNANRWRAWVADELSQRGYLSMKVVGEKMVLRVTDEQRAFVVDLVKELPDSPLVVEDDRRGVVYWKQEGNDHTEDAGPASLVRGDEDLDLFDSRWVDLATAERYARRNGHECKAT